MDLSQCLHYLPPNEECGGKLCAEGKSQSELIILALKLVVVALFMFVLSTYKSLLSNTNNTINIDAHETLENVQQPLSPQQECIVEASAPWKWTFTIYLSKKE